MGLRVPIDHINECIFRSLSGLHDCICDNLRAYEERIRQMKWIEEVKEKNRVHDELCQVFDLLDHCHICTMRDRERLSVEWLKGWNEAIDRSSACVDTELNTWGWGPYLRGLMMTAVQGLKG